MSNVYFVSALKKSEQAVLDLEEKRRIAQEEAAAIIKAKEEAEAKRVEVEELAKKNELEKEQMVCIHFSYCLAMHVFCFH